MENAKQQLIDAIKDANNVLVTVSKNPGVDELSAAIGLTLLLNKMGKHGTAVYSGATPSAIDFLKPDMTIEKNTDSLRDFIIALDKSKADKLRYKVEGDHVRIFITPYKTSISEKDLDFSQGDFNVDVVVALGVLDQRDLDSAIISHGRILHDATTISVTTGEKSSLGSVNWADSRASSLCEMVTSLVDHLQPEALDSQMATSLMTGIVSETQRFSNDKTTSGAMSASAKLMSAGANQQLVASELQQSDKPEAVESQEANTSDELPSNDGELQIEHIIQRDNNIELGSSDSDDLDAEVDKIINAQPQPDANNIVTTDSNSPVSKPEGPKGSSLILEPPVLGSKLTAGADINSLEPAIDALARDKGSPILSRQKTSPPEPKYPQSLGGTKDLPSPTMTLPSEVNQQTNQVAPSVQQLDVNLTKVDSKAAGSTVTAPNLSPKSAPMVSATHEASDGNKLPGAKELAKAMEPSNPLPPSPIASLDSARESVMSAMAGNAQPLPPLKAISSETVVTVDHSTESTTEIDHIDETTGVPSFKKVATDNDPVNEHKTISQLEEVTNNTTEAVHKPVEAPASEANELAPPPVPPPMMPFNPNPAPSVAQAASTGSQLPPTNLPPVLH